MKACKTLHDPVYEYINHMFSDMDPETMFTFLTRDGLAAILSFLTTISHHSDACQTRPQAIWASQS